MSVCYFLLFSPFFLSPTTFSAVSGPICTKFVTNGLPVCAITFFACCDETVQNNGPIIGTFDIISQIILQDKDPPTPSSIIEVNSGVKSICNCSRNS